MKKLVIILGVVALISVVATVGVAWYLLDQAKRTIDKLKMVPAQNLRWPKKPEHQNGSAALPVDPPEEQPKTTV